MHDAATGWSRCFPSALCCDRQAVGQVPGDRRVRCARVLGQLGLRVEAEGYAPQRYTWIDKSRGAQTIVFRLQKGGGITGRAVLPDGEPAAGAEIGIHMTSRGPRLNGASLGFNTPIPKDLRARWSRGVVVKADALGRFRLPIEADPTAYIVAVHAAGTCQILLDDFEPEKPLNLIGWGRVEGTVMIGKQPGANAKVTVYHAPSPQSVYPSSLPHFHDLRSDANGRFVIERFPHGVGAVALPEYIPVNDGSHPAGFSHIPPIPKNAMGRFHVKSGETTVITIGGEGLGPKIEDSDGRK